MSASYQARTDIPAHIFRAYDIRGRVDAELNEDVYYTLGLSVGSMLREKGLSVCVTGFDGRLHSEAYARALNAGLCAAGVDVVRVGLVSSPVLYYALHHLGISSGLMVTGSHNPKDYNGIKIVVEGKSLTADSIASLYQRLLNGNFTTGQGHCRDARVIDAYVDEITQNISLSRKLKVAIDCGNGVAGLFAGRLFEQLGAEVIPLYCEPDGHFPNHHPDPSVVDNLQDLIACVQENQCDIGLAFDGDADRLGVVTELGEIIWPDRQLMMLAVDILSRNPGANIVYDVKCTRYLAEVINAASGVARMSPTGHSIVKAQMRDSGALLAGEMSGHLFIKDRWYGFDDALYAGARLLEVLTKENGSVSEQFQQFPNSVNTPEIKIPVDEHRKFSLMEAIKKDFHIEGGKAVHIDGVRMEFSYGWGLIRASNTSPFLVSRFEADDEASLLQLQLLFKQKLINIDKSLSIPF